MRMQDYGKGLFIRFCVVFDAERRHAARGGAGKLAEQGFDPHNAGGLDKVISARGTLVFFDNSHSTGQTPDLSGVFGKKKPNIVRRTLEKAKARLFGSSAEQRQPTQADAPSLLQQQEIYASQPTGPKLMTLDYTGAKTIAAIPPDTYVEVPFVRHIPYYFRNHPARR